jgi:hypothetical protein
VKGANVFNALCGALNLWCSGLMAGAGVYHMAVMNGCIAVMSVCMALVCWKVAK